MEKKTPPQPVKVADIRVSEELDELFRYAREYDRLINGKNLASADWERLGKVLREANSVLAAGLD